MLDHVSPSERRGTAFTFATAALGFMAWALPNMSRYLTIPGAVFCAGTAIYLFLPDISTLFRRHKLAILLCMIVCFGFIGCAAWYFWPASVIKVVEDFAGAANGQDCFDPKTAAPDVKDAFEKINSSAPGLVRSPDCFRVMPSAARAVYEKAVVLWTSNPPQLFFLHDDRTWDRVSEDSWCPEKWCYDSSTSVKSAGRQHFKSFGHPPKGEFPPYGGVALWLDKNPSQFNKLGWLVKHCQMELNKTLYAKTEAGFVIGIFPQNLIASNVGWIYELRSNRTWETHTAAGYRESCSPEQSH